MTIAGFNDTKFTCSPLLFCLLPAAALFGELSTVLIALISLSIHELSHASMALRLGRRIRSIEIQPFGFIANLEDDPATPSECIAISAIGPAMSLLLAISGAGFMYFFSVRTELIARFVSFNLSIGLMNLLPVLPLDGGRLLQSLLNLRYRARSTEKILSAVGIFVGVSFVFLGVLVLSNFKKSSACSSELTFASVSAIITGSFIAISAAKLLSKRDFHSVRSHFVAKRRLNSGGSLSVRAIAMNAHSTVREAAMCIQGHNYNLIIVVDDTLHTIGTLDEGELTSLLLNGKSTLKIGSAVLMCNQNSRYIR